jgi:hypothetical protein
MVFQVVLVVDLLVVVVAVLEHQDRVILVLVVHIQQVLHQAVAVPRKLGKEVILLLVVLAVQVLQIATLDRQ